MPALKDKDSQEQIQQSLATACHVQTSAKQSQVWGFQSVCLTALKEVLWSRKYERRHKPYNIGEKKSYFPLGWLHLNIQNTAHNKETLSVNIQLAR